MNMFAEKRNSFVLECGCEYYGSSVDAAGGRGSVEKNKQSLATAAARVI